MKTSKKENKIAQDAQSQRTRENPSYRMAGRSKPTPTRSKAVEGLARAMEF